MAHSAALVATDRPARYARQLVAHLSRRHGGEWDADAGTGWIALGDGRAEVAATDAGLVMRVEGPDDATLERLEDVVARHLVRFATQDELTVAWTRQS